jgi:hypothetical protein
VASREGVVETLLSATLGLAWSFRVELALVAALASASAAAVRYLGPVAGPLAVAVPLGAVAAWPTSRRWTWRKLRHASIRRRYLAAVRVAGFDRLKLNRAPSVIKVRDTPAGYSLQVRLPAGTSPLTWTTAPR